jgi:hypothetical protein
MRHALKSPMDHTASRRAEGQHAHLKAVSRCSAGGVRGSRQRSWRTCAQRRGCTRVPWACRPSQSTRAGVAMHALARAGTQAWRRHGMHSPTPCPRYGLKLRGAVSPGAHLSASPARSSAAPHRGAGAGYGAPDVCCQVSTCQGAYAPLRTSGGRLSSHLVGSRDRTPLRAVYACLGRTMRPARGACGGSWWSRMPDPCTAGSSSRSCSLSQVDRSGS